MKLFLDVAVGVCRLLCSAFCHVIDFAHEVGCRHEMRVRISDTSSRVNLSGDIYLQDRALDSNRFLLRLQTTLCSLKIH